MKRLYVSALTIFNLDIDGVRKHSKSDISPAFYISLRKPRLPNSNWSSQLCTSSLHLFSPSPSLLFICPPLISPLSLSISHPLHLSSSQPLFLYSTLLSFTSTPFSSTSLLLAPPPHLSSVFFSPLDVSPFLFLYCTPLHLSPSLISSSSLSPILSIHIPHHLHFTVADGDSCSNRQGNASPLRALPPLRCKGAVLVPH